MKQSKNETDFMTEPTSALVQLGDGMKNTKLSDN